MDDIELLNVEATSPLMRAFNPNDTTYKEEKVHTPYGAVVVAHHGLDTRTHASKPVFVTYPDLGLNHITNYQAFFNNEDVKMLTENFAVLHMNAPGTEDGAPTLPDDFKYPTMDQLAEQVGIVLQQLNITCIIGLGVGLGANVLSRFALKNQNKCDGLFLINATAGVSSWMEWIYQKRNMYYLSGPGNLTGVFPQATQDYLMWHHFGYVDNRNPDLMNMYKNYFSGGNLNARNLSLLIESFIGRSDIGIVRDDKNIKCPVLLLCGNFSPHEEDTVNFNARLNPNNSTWMKLSDCGMVLEEQPGKVFEALRLFVQGLGYSLTKSERRRSSLAKGTRQMGMDLDDKGMHIVENPIAIR